MKRSWINCSSLFLLKSGRVTNFDDSTEKKHLKISQDVLISCDTNLVPSFSFIHSQPVMVRNRLGWILDATKLAIFATWLFVGRLATNTGVGSPGWLK